MKDNYETIIGLESEIISISEELDKARKGGHKNLIVNRAEKLLSLITQMSKLRKLNMNERIMKRFLSILINRNSKKNKKLLKFARDKINEDLKANSLK